MKEKDFRKLAHEVIDSDSPAFSKHDLEFCELYLSSQKKFSSRLFKAFPDVIDKLVEKDKIKGDREDLIKFLEEYLKIFKNKKEHQIAHKKNPCLKCNLAKELLKKLRT